MSNSWAQELDSNEIKHAKSKVQVPEWINQMVNDTGSSAKPRLLFYPTIGFSPETRWEFGASGLVVFHYNNDTNLRLSEISAFGFYTEMKQLGLWIDHAIYGKDNQILILGKMRFQNYPLLYYGIGNNISNKPLAVVPANYYNVRERFVYRLNGNLFAGLEMDYQQLAQPEFDWHEHVHRHDSALPTGANGSKNLGLGVGVLWDSRHNILNVREGFLAEVAFLHYGKIFSESFPMNTLFLDGRYFHAVKKNQVLALQVVGQFSSGNVPFNQLSLMGGEMIMRGHYLGKYRDKQYVAAQAEYRFLPFGFSKRLGGAVFASAGAVSSSFPTQNYKIAGGAGLRYLLFPKKDIFTRIDVGFEKEGYGIYFFIGEAF